MSQPANSSINAEENDVPEKVTVYTPQSPLADIRLLFKEMWRELTRSGELSYALFVRNMKAQFRQSLLGYAWLFFPPLANTLVWFFLNRSGVVAVADTGMPYPAFVLIGTLLWQAFLDSLLKPVTSLTAAGPMLVKLNFPRIAPVMAGILETALLSGVRLVLLIPVFVVCDLVPGWTAIFFPLGYFALVILGSAIGILLTPLGLLYTDFGRAIGVIGQFAMYATPVVYPVATMGLLGMVNRYNPVTYMLEMCRNLLVGGSLESLPYGIAISLTGCVLLLVGWAILHITVPRIIERMGM